MVGNAKKGIESTYSMTTAAAKGANNPQKMSQFGADNVTFMRQFSMGFVRFFIHFS